MTPTPDRPLRPASGAGVWRSGWLRAHAALAAAAVVAGLVVDLGSLAESPGTAQQVLALVVELVVGALGLPLSLLLGFVAADSFLPDPATPAGLVFSEVVSLLPVVLNVAVHALGRYALRSGALPDLGQRGTAEHGSRAGWYVPTLAVASAGCWAGWMGWDVHRDLNPATGELTGPYQPWQVAGCVLCLVVLAAAATRVLNATTVAATVTLAFTIAWSVSAALLDDQGLWPIGATLVLFGTAMGSALIAFTSAVGWHWRSRHGSTSDVSRP